MSDVKSFLTGLVRRASSNDTVRRLVHTFWQAFVAALLVSAAGVHDLGSAKAVLLAAVAAALSAVKSAVAARASK